MAARRLHSGAQRAAWTATHAPPPAPTLPQPRTCQASAGERSQGFLAWLAPRAPGVRRLEVVATEEPNRQTFAVGLVWNNFLCAPWARAGGVVGLLAGLGRAWWGMSWTCALPGCSVAPARRARTQSTPCPHATPARSCAVTLAGPQLKELTIDWPYELVVGQWAARLQRLQKGVFLGGLVSLGALAH